MARSLHSRIARRFLVSAALLLLSVCAALAAPRMTGTISSTTTAVGEPVEYELTIAGAEAPDDVQLPAVDGLDVRSAGTRSQMSIINGEFSRRTVFTFTLTPKRQGKFTIPPVEVTVAGQKLRTQAVALTVGAGEPARGAGDLAFATVWIERKSLYLGETVPIELRVYLDASARWELRSMPVLEGDGFTTQPIGKPAQTNVPLADKTYILLSYRTVITPGKAGKLTIGPIPVKLVYSKLTRRQPALDILGRDFGPAQALDVNGAALDLQVKPLPADGRPKDFSGAVGKFEFTASGSPDRVKLGEPVSMKLTIRGAGNFDRISQPVLDDPTGWTAYSAKQQFDPSDTAGTSGMKTFELPVTPTAKKQTMPVFSFTYFDPEAEKYVTLKSNAAPLAVEGEPAPIAVNTTPVTAPAVPQPAAPAARDIRPNLPELGSASIGFGLHAHPAILFSIMFAPLPVILALLAWRSRKRDANAARIAALRRDKSGLAGEIRRGASRAEVLDAAARLLVIEAALTTGQSPAELELPEVLAARKLDSTGENAVRGLFESRNELHYAGSSPADDRIGDAERDRVLETVATYERAGRR